MSTRPIPYLYPTHARSEFPNAPDYDPTKPIKNWIADPPPTSDPVTFRIFDDNYNVVEITMSKQDAITPNFVGHHAYPPYAPAPGLGTFSGAPWPSGILLSTRVEAEAMAAELGLDNSKITDFIDQFLNTVQANYSPLDMRRAWLLNGVSVGQLLAEKYANGVGAPGAWSGKWDVSQPRPTWVGAIPSNAAAPGAKVLGVPLGPIAADEHVIHTGPLGVDLELEKPDAPVSVTVGTGIGGLTADEHAIVVRMGAWLSKVGG